MPVNKEHAFAGGVVYQHRSVRLKQWATGLASAPMATLKSIISYYISPVQFRLASAWRQIEKNCSFDLSLRIGPNAWCSNYQGKFRNRDILIGPSSILRGVIRVDRGGNVTIGRNVYIGDDVIISSSSGVSIADNTMIAHGVHIFDNDSHPLDWRARMSQNEAYREMRAHEVAPVPSAPVVIGSNVWIGFNSFVGKGVTIGDRSVVAACSIVLKNVPSDCLVAGSPAKVIRTLSPNSLA